MSSTNQHNSSLACMSQRPTVAMLWFVLFASLLGVTSAAGAQSSGSLSLNRASRADLAAKVTELEAATANGVVPCARAASCRS